VSRSARRRDWRDQFGLAAGLALLGLALAPLILSALGALGPAFGYFPALGGDRLSLAPWREALAVPGIGRSILLSLWIGLVATLLATAIAFALAGAMIFGGSARWARRVSEILLAAPHAAMALALVFLLGPSGLLARLPAQVFGWERPADYLFPGDPFGLAAILGLAVKEAPFLLIVALNAARGLDPAAWSRQSASLGYRPMRGFLLGFAPQLYPRIRLAVFVALAFATASVEQALVLGPTVPPTLAVRLVQWFNDPDLSSRFPLAAGALLLAGAVAVAFGLWRGGEIIAGRTMQVFAAQGARRGALDLAAALLARLGQIVFFGAILALAAQALSSIAQSWRFPDLVPSAWSLDLWARSPRLIGAPIANSLSLAAFCAIAAPVLALIGLEATGQRPLLRRALTLAFFTPLFVPEPSFVFGLASFWAAWRLDGQWANVAWAHLIYTLPYAWLLLLGPHEGLDRRLTASARVLGAGPLATFWRVRAPMLLAPILSAAALSVVVSTALYLPTLAAGAGRIATLVTESLVLAGSGDRRLVGVMSVILVATPLLALALADLGPRWAYRRRALLREAAR